METTRLSLFYRGLIVLAGVLLAQFVMVGYQLRSQTDIPLVRYGTVLVIDPIHRAMNSVSDSIRSVWLGYINLRGAREQSANLSQQVDQLKLENQQLQFAADEAKRLRALMDLKAVIPSETVVARVLGGSAGETARLLMIDKGARQGLRQDAPVMVPDGVVGKVLAVFPDSAQVILLSDPFSGAGVLLEQNRMHGILKGRNEELMQLDFIPNGERITLGQRVFTSGEDKIYPRGLAVGVVERASPGPRFQDIRVRSLAQLQSLEEVIVIVGTSFDLPLPEPAPLVSEPLEASSAKSAPLSSSAPPIPQTSIRGPQIQSLPAATGQAPAAPAAVVDALQPLTPAMPNTAQPTTQPAKPASNPIPAR